MSFEVDTLNDAQDALDAPVAAATMPVVWVVENDFVVNTAFALQLESAGYDAVQLFNAGDVEAQSGCPHLVLLDICLDDSDAVDVFKILHDKRIKAPIQIISASGAEILEAMVAVGRRRHFDVLPPLRKPVLPAELMTVLARTLGLCAATPLVGPEAIAGERTPEPIDLGEALRENWLEVFYQPKYDLATGAIVGAECLSRVRHPERGLVPPGAFLPSARQEDVAALADAVIRRACADWPALEAAGHPTRLAVNVPGPILTRLPIARLLREVAPRSPRWPGLFLELTEEEALQDVGAACDIAAQLKLYDVYLSIDDFGVGYSGLARLREIPFKEVKLDRSLVDGCADDEVRASLCRSVVDLAHSFGARAVAEGVEREVDAACLHRLGCDIAQGYLFARPMPLADFIAALAGAPRAIDTRPPSLPPAQPRARAVA